MRGFRLLPVLVLPDPRPLLLPRLTAPHAARPVRLRLRLRHDGFDEQRHVADGGEEVPPVLLPARTRPRRVVELLANLVGRERGRLAKTN